MVTATAQSKDSSPRQWVPLSGEGWQFFGVGGADVLPDLGSSAYTSAPWSDVSIPHDFQTRTDMSLDQGWYRRKLTVTPLLARKHLYLVFEGAASVADVYVDGKLLGEHRGAYTRFIYDITSDVHIGQDNEIDVKVDNRLANLTDLLPNANGLYEVWGGLYRHVWLLATNELQIDPTYYASPGVFITPSAISATSANLDVKVLLRNTSSKIAAAEVHAFVIDPSGKTVQTLTGQTSVDADSGSSVDLKGDVPNPLPCEPGSPNVYHVRVTVSDGGVLTDSVLQPLGFRTLVWDFKNATLSVNGKPYILYGVDLHQETEDKQSAVEPDDLKANIDSLQDLGANWVRFSHYPRAEVEYDLCDERGIFCWAENGHSHKDIPSPTADQITTEMVEQNYNHPSIIVWSVGNEGAEAPAVREVPIVRALDPSRACVVANMRCPNADYDTANMYPGWYGYDRWSFELTRFVSETGAGGVVSDHCDYADAKHKVDYYEPEEYQQLVDEADFEQAFRHNTGHVGMLTYWTLRDFNDHKYKRAGAPFGNGINTKGLETYAGFKKDVYYLYRSFLRPDTPTVHITSKLYFLRQGAVDNGIKVYSNAKSLTLTVDGQVISTLQNGMYKQDDPLYAGDQTVDNVFYWPAPLHTGKNIVTASDGEGDTDTATIYFYGPDGLPELPNPSPPITNLVSSNAANPVYYMDMPVQAQWPFYYDFDSTGDNTLDSIPAQLQGASWLALHRVTKTGFDTKISFTVAHPATVYVVCTKTDSDPQNLLDASFKQVDIPSFRWRDNNLILVDALLYAKKVKTGDSENLALGDRDTLVLFKAD